MAITAQQIIDKAEIILQDNTNVRWPADELLGWLNDGQREIVKIKPEANPVNGTMQLAVGTKQALPAGGIQLIDVVRNMGSTGSTAGDVVTNIPRAVLDQTNRSWHTETPVATIDHYMFDDRDPKHFYVYPPSNGTGHVELIYSASPTDILIGANITLDDYYSNALLNYILYRAYSKDANFSANDGRSRDAMNLFLNAMGIYETSEKANNPNYQTRVTMPQATVVNSSPQ